MGRAGEMERKRKKEKGKKAYSPWSMSQASWAGAGAGGGGAMTGAAGGAGAGAGLGVEVLRFLAAFFGDGDGFSWRTGFFPDPERLLVIMDGRSCSPLLRPRERSDGVCQSAHCLKFESERTAGGSCNEAKVRFVVCRLDGRGLFASFFFSLFLSFFFLFFFLSLLVSRELKTPAAPLDSKDAARQAREKQKLDREKERKKEKQMKVGFLRFFSVPPRPPMLAEAL